MSEKHTPGPWTKAVRLNGPWWHISSGNTIGGKECKSGRQAIASVHGESKRGSKAYAEMFEANARLIAAAPELLEALQELVDCPYDIDTATISTLGLEETMRINPDQVVGAASICLVSMRRARAAIAKATGAQP